MADEAGREPPERVTRSSPDRPPPNEVPSDYEREMEALGLNPRNIGHCEAYDSYLEDQAVSEVEQHMAEEEAAIGAQDIADQVVLDAIERAASATDPVQAERIVAEAHRTADAYLAERLRGGLVRAPVGPFVIRARKREPRTRRARRVRIRSGSRGDPPDEGDDDEAEPPGRAVARPVCVGGGA
jgi:hypothetical protein